MKIATDIIDLAATSAIVLPKTSGIGLKVDSATPTYGWRDIIGNLNARGVGADAAAGGDTCTDAVFGHTADVHYQSTNMATKSKAPDFYT